MPRMIDSPNDLIYTAGVVTSWVKRKPIASGIIAIVVSMTGIDMALEKDKAPIPVRIALGGITAIGSGLGLGLSRLNHLRSSRTYNVIPDPLQP